MLNIVFVCTGNTCRSPMAEYLFRQKTLHFKGFFNVLSYGMNAANGQPANENAVIAMDKRGIDISMHKSSHITSRIVSEADYIFCLSNDQYDIISAVEPEKTFLLGGGISDPYGMDVETYDNCAQQISDAIDELLLSDLFFSEPEIMEFDDIPVVADIERACFSMPWTESAFFKHLSRPYARSFVVKYLNKPVGYICCDFFGEEMFVGTIATDIAMRRRGVAEKLISMMCDLSSYLGAVLLSLEVRESNIPAQNLYVKYGFKNQGKRKNFYSKPTEDALIMTRFFIGEEHMNENISY